MTANQHSVKFPATDTTVTALRGEIEACSTWIANQAKEEKHARKKNLIIKGLKFDMSKPLAEINTFVLKNFQLSDAILQVKNLSRASDKPLLWAEVASREDRLKMLTTWSKYMRDHNIYISPDLSRDERVIAFHLREQARKAKLDGKQAKALGQRLVIDNVLYTWSLAGNELARLDVNTILTPGRGATQRGVNQPLNPESGTTQLDVNHLLTLESGTTQPDVNQSLTPTENGAEPPNRDTTSDVNTSKNGPTLPNQFSA